jgi:hypothetical protein
MDIKLFQNEKNHSDLSEVLTLYKAHLSIYVPMFEYLFSFYKKVGGGLKRTYWATFFLKKLFRKWKKCNSKIHNSNRNF